MVILEQITFIKVKMFHHSVTMISQSKIVFICSFHYSKGTSGPKPCWQKDSIAESPNPHIVGV